MAIEKNKEYLSLIALKDNGGLVYPSEDVMRILRVSENAFKAIVSGADGTGINASKHLRQKITLTVIKELSITSPGKILFESTLQHDVESHVPGQDLHSTQIMKAVVKAFLDIRLPRYGQEYTKSVVKAGSEGKRQQLNKLILFKGL